MRETLIARYEGSAENIEAAYRAARETDLEELQRLHEGLSERLSEVDADALWQELAEVLHQQPYERVVMHGEQHSLRIGFNERGVAVLELCSDCEALHLTLGWLRHHPVVTGDPDLMEQVQALVEHNDRAMAQLNAGESPDTRAVREQLQAIGERHQIACLSCLADASAAAKYPRFVQSLDVVGRPLDELRLEEAFNESWQIYHIKDRVYLRRKKGQISEAPELRVRDDGTVTFNDLPSPGSAPIDVDRPTVEVLDDMVQRSSSLRKYLEGTESVLGWDRPRHLELADQALSELRGSATVATVRHDIKMKLREALLREILTVEGGPKHAVEQMLKLMQRLDPSDGGPLTEVWLIRYRELYEGLDTEELLRHLKLDAGKNPGMGGTRDVDQGLVMNQQTGEVRGNEVKGGAGPLTGKDTEQIGDMLKGIAQAKAEGDQAGALATRGAGKDKTEYRMTSLKLTLLNRRNAMGSAEKLKSWLNEYEELFILEVFAPDGRAVEIHWTDFDGSAEGLRDVIRGL